MEQQWGFRWRSSNVFIITAVVGALFLDKFLYSFIVPILSHLLEQRLHVDPSRTQSMTSALLAIYGIAEMLSGPPIGHFADKSSRKTLWIIFSVAGYIPGTVLIAWAPAVWALYVGRIIQAVAGSGVWILGFAILTDITNKDRLGRLMGFTMSFITAGVIAGPMAGGFLLHLVGYWLAWSVCLGLVAIDLLAVLLIMRVERCPTDEESMPLVSEMRNKKGSNGWKFYRIMLTDARAQVSLAGAFVWSIVVSGFDTTLPLHVRDSFSWNSLLMGAMFGCFQLPALVLNPLAGWLRDRVGLRMPAAIGFALLSPAFLLLGTPGQFRWATEHSRGVPIYIASISFIGAVSSLIVSIAPMGLTRVLNDYERTDPYIFGPQGGLSRVFAMAEIAWTGGLVVGPLLTGGLTNSIGYFWMNTTLAAISLILAVWAFLAL